MIVDTDKDPNPHKATLLTSKGISRTRRAFKEEFRYPVGSELLEIENLMQEKEDATERRVKRASFSREKKS